MFEGDFNSWLDAHVTGRVGARWERIANGLGYGEMLFLQEVWWPGFGDFAHLHPEYEVVDVVAGRRYLDFAYLRDGVKIGIELDGYNTHAAPPTRAAFNDQWVRQMQLMNLGWIIIRIAVDDLRERPVLWQQLLQQYLGRYFTNNGAKIETKLELELLNYLFHLHRPARRTDVEYFLGCKYEMARRIIEELVKQGWLTPAIPHLKRKREWCLTSKFRFLGMPADVGHHLIPNKERNRYLGGKYAK
jgi:predicted transcriptional regulator